MYLHSVMLLITISYAHSSRCTRHGGVPVTLSCALRRWHLACPRGSTCLCCVRAVCCISHVMHLIRACCRHRACAWGLGSRTRVLRQERRPKAAGTKSGGGGLAGGLSWCALSLRPSVRADDKGDARGAHVMPGPGVDQSAPHIRMWPGML